MRLIVKFAIGIVAFIIFLAIIGTIVYFSTSAKSNTTASPIVTIAPTSTDISTVTITPTPDVISQPTAMVMVSSTPAFQQIANIAIAYSYQTVQSITGQDGFVSNPNSGNVYLELTMTIQNNGYDNSFSTDPIYFSVTSNNVMYLYDFGGTYWAGGWNTEGLLNDETYTGTLVFQVPSTASTFAVGWQQISTATTPNFNIIWTQTRP